MEASKNRTRHGRKPSDMSHDASNFEVGSCWLMKDMKTAGKDLAELGRVRRKEATLYNMDPNDGLIQRSSDGLLVVGLDARVCN